MAFVETTVKKWLCLWFKGFIIHSVFGMSSSSVNDIKSEERIEKIFGNFQNHFSFMKVCHIFKYHIWLNPNLKRVNYSSESIEQDF